MIVLRLLNSSQASSLIHSTFNREHLKLNVCVLDYWAAVLTLCTMATWLLHTRHARPSASTKSSSFPRVTRPINPTAAWHRPPTAMRWSSLPLPRTLLLPSRTWNSVGQASPTPLIPFAYCSKSMEHTLNYSFSSGLTPFWIFPPGEIGRASCRESVGISCDSV